MFKQKQLAVLIGAFVATMSAQAVFAADVATTDAGSVTITGSGDKLGAGLLQQEDTPKARSSITRSAIDKARATSNPYQLIEQIPSVNTSSHDATGLFGGSLSIRGFNSDQLGFTVNGAPVNDSGNFAVYPQEYTDTENLCEVFVTQGSADTDSPHVGATGGNIGMVSCAPEDKQRFKFIQTIGQNNFIKTFARIDIGKVGDFKAYTSYSIAQVDKFRGKGKADREHADMGFQWDLAPGNVISGSFLYNKAVNNNYRSVSMAQYKALGSKFDYWNTYDTTYTSNSSTTLTPTGANSAYYALSLNPFENSLTTLKGNFQLTEKIRLDVEPYFWYGYGTGGVEEGTLKEGSFYNSATGTNTAAKDINGNGTTTDTVLVYSGSVTKTYRPGVTFRLNAQVDNHKLMGGLWYEQARHIQTRPATTLSSTGVPADLWLQDALITRPDGSLYQGRDVKTISTASELFLQDSISLLDDKLTVILGLRRPQINRDFTNNASEGSGAGVYYTVDKTYSKTLPSFAAKYQLDETSHLFFNIAQTFKAPGNFTYFGLYNSTTKTLNPLPVTPESATNLDLGYRFQGQALTASATAFATEYKDRIAQGYDSLIGVNVARNVGDVSLRGAEFELGLVPVSGFSAYASLTYTKSELKSDLLSNSGTNITKPTTGKEYIFTPNWLAGITGQYAQGPFYVQLKGKYTGKQYSTFMNDEELPATMIWDLNMGYKFADLSIIKNPSIKFSISNLTDKAYLTPNNGSGTSLVTNATGTGASTVGYYVGAPRFLSVAFSGEF